MIYVLPNMLPFPVLLRYMFLFHFQWSKLCPFLSLNFFQQYISCFKPQVLTKATAAESIKHWSCQLIQVFIYNITCLYLFKGWNQPSVIILFFLDWPVNFYSLNIGNCTVNVCHEYRWPRSWYSWKLCS